jgi:hypothetical protein
VLAEGGDYLADAAAIGVSLLAMWLSARPVTPDRDFGHPRATKIAALVNGGWLLVLSVLVALGAVGRLVTGSWFARGLPATSFVNVSPGGVRRLYLVRPSVSVMALADGGQVHAVDGCLHPTRARHTHQRAIGVGERQVLEPR